MGHDGGVTSLNTHSGSQLRDELITLGRSHGLAAIGVCDAEPFVETRLVLEQRRDQGLNADMAFTYRNPARSTDPSRSLPGVKSMLVGAFRYETAVPDPPSAPAARVARYATADSYEQLRFALQKVADKLIAAGWPEATVLARAQQRFGLALDGTARAQMFCSPEREAGSCSDQS